LGARLGIIDGAINRTGAAAPAVSDACIVCTGASVAATPELVARRTVDVLRRPAVPRSSWADAYRKHASRARISLFIPDEREQTPTSSPETGQIPEPENEASWIARQSGENGRAVFFLHGALTEELSRALLAQRDEYNDAELVVEDGTKIFCHTVVLQRLAERGLNIRVAAPIRLLALTINPYTPDYTCTPALLLEALHFSAFPDAAGALRWAHRLPARVVVVSNWDMSLEEVLARLGLAQLLDGIVTSAGAGARKPSAAIFARALELAGAAPEPRARSVIYRLPGPDDVKAGDALWPRDPHAAALYHHGARSG